MDAFSHFLLMSVVVGGLVSMGGASPATASCGYIDCETYCSGSCPFRPNISSPGQVESLKVWRITPYNITDLPNHDTGDAPGDMGFLLQKYMENSECIPPYNTEECFLDDFPIVAEFNVDMYASYGPYLHCNPTPYSPDGRFVNLDEFTCGYGHPGPDLWHPLPGMGCPAPCNRVNFSVGKDPAHHVWNTTASSKLHMSSYFGGYWYSTPALGQCKGDAVPGDSSGCTWRLTPNSTNKYINASCLADHLFNVLKAKNPTCFTACGPGAGRGNTCFGKCVTDTVLGVPAGTGKGVNVDDMIHAWTEAFDGGCPLLPPHPHTSLRPLSA